MNEETGAIGQVNATLKGEAAMNPNEMVLSIGSDGARDGPAYLTPKQAAALLQVPVSWVYNKTRTGSFPGQRRVGKYVRIHRGELLEWVERQRGRVPAVSGRTAAQSLYRR